MLTELKVSQFAIIDSIHINFFEGLNILSGETGAGKSILIKSLALLMGAKSSQQDIRSNKDRAIIEGAFDLSDREDILDKLSERGIDTEDATLIVRRVLQRTGKSKVYLNGHLSTISDLRQVVSPLVTLSDPSEAPLIEITGQHENKDLMSARYQMDLLDQFCANSSLRNKVQVGYSQIQDIQNKIVELEERSQQREQQIDFLEFQINEIEELSLEPGEDEIISEKIRDLKQQESWQSWVDESLETVNNADHSILSLLGRVLQSLPDSPSLGEVRSQLEQGRSIMEEAAFQLQQLHQRDFDSEENLDDLEDRLSRIRKLQKKFGESVNEILQALAEMKQEHSELSNLSETLEHLQQQKQKIQNSTHKEALKLRKKRAEGAQRLAKEVNKELKDLNMKGLKFLISLAELNELQATGLDRVVFQTQTGAQDEARELAKAASGGELSRILLSLKQVAGHNAQPRTYLFDEVDTGVSGPTAEKVGAKLKNIAKEQQVICVTHLPQVACFGDYHFYIEKAPNKKTVEMSVTQLDQKARINEIARLISGEKVSKTSIAHARQLLSL